MSIEKIVGEIHLDHGVYIADPGSHSSKRKPYPIKPGKYTCKIQLYNEYVASIGVYLDNIDPAIADMKRIGRIGVDSGIAGFSYYNPNYNDWEWQMFCDFIHKTKEDAWITEDGFFSHSGYGDGLYEVYAIKNSEGIAIAIEIRFIDCEEIKERAALKKLHVLQEAIIPDGVTRIPSFAFSGAKVLKSVIVPNGVKYIGSYVFNSCPSLISVVLPGSLENIDDYAFYGCSSLSEIYFENTKERWQHITKGVLWNDGQHKYVVHCSDGEIDY